MFPLLQDKKEYYEIPVTFGKVKLCESSCTV